MGILTSTWRSDRDPDATRLQDILASFDCTQHVPLTPTHRGGGTLDLVVTKSEQTLTEMKVDPPDITVSSAGAAHSTFSQVLC